MPSPQDHYTSFAVPRIQGDASPLHAVPWHEILPLGVRLSYARNCTIQAVGPSRFDLFYIEEGQVQVVFDTLDGRMRSVVSFEAGSLFNLAQAAAQAEASGQYHCVTDVVVWKLPGELLHDAAFAARYPALMLGVIHTLGRLVLTHHTFLTDMLMDDFVIRFSRFLVSMGAGQGDEFAPGMTQEHLANMLGVHRATLARAIHQLKHDGVIDGFTKKRVRILNWERLRVLATGDIK